MRRKRGADHLLKPGEVLVKVEPGDDGAPAGVGGLVLPGEDEEVSGLASLEKAGFALELFLRGARARFGGSDPLPGRLDTLESVPDLSLDAHFDLSLLEPKTLFGDHALGEVRISRPVPKVEVNLQTGLDGLISATKHVGERSSVSADKKVRRRANRDVRKRRDAGQR